MKIKIADDVKATAFEGEGASGVQMRMLLGPAEEAPNFNMRRFDVAPGGHTPLHAHAWEHEVYVLAGEGVVRQGGAEQRITAGNCVYVPPDEKHQFANAGSETLQFICVVPRT